MGFVCSFPFCPCHWKIAVGMSFTPLSGSAAEFSAQLFTLLIVFLSSKIPLWFVFMFSIYLVLELLNLSLHCFLDIFTLFI